MKYKAFFNYNGSGMEVEKEIDKDERVFTKDDHPFIVGNFVGMLIGIYLKSNNLIELNEDNSWKHIPTDIVLMTISNKHETIIYDSRTLQSNPTNLE